jgi:hypothetical protein
LYKDTGARCRSPHAERTNSRSNNNQSKANQQHTEAIYHRGSPFDAPGAQSARSLGHDCPSRRVVIAVARFLHQPLFWLQQWWVVVVMRSGGWMVVVFIWSRQCSPSMRVASCRPTKSYLQQNSGCKPI